MSNIHDYRRIAILAKPYFGKLIAIFFILVLLYSASYAHPYLYKILIDDAIESGSLRLLWQIVLAMFGLALLRQGLSVLSHYLFSVLESRFFYEYQSGVLQHLLYADILRVSNKDTGDTISRVNDDVKVVESFITNDLANVFQNALFLLFGTVFIFYLNWKLAALTLPVLLLVPLCIDLLKVRVRSTSTKLRELNGKTVSLIEQIVSGLYLIRAHSLMQHFTRQYDVIGESLVNHRRRLAKLQNIGGAAAETVVSIITIIIVLGVGGSFVIKGAFTIGGIVAFHSYVRMMLGPSVSLFRTQLKIQQFLGSLDRVEEITSLKPFSRCSEDASCVKPELVKGRITMSDVSFGYGDAPILKSISMTIKPGSRTAIVGGSGSGKSTLLALLSGIYNPETGSIQLDGINIRDIENLHELVSVVPQDAYLFNTSIKKNILMGKNDQFLSVSKALNLAKADFVTDENDLVGSRGLALSGGERQRLCLARALARNTPVLLLDEAGANLDPEVDMFIQSAIKELSKDMTIVYATHKLHTLHDYDNIIVLQKGKIIEQGTHDELMDSKLHYFKQFNSHKASVE